MQRDSTAVDTFHVSTKWLTDHGIDPAKVCSYQLQDDSLEPQIPRGSNLLIDTGDTNVVSGQYYAVERGGELSIMKLDSDLDDLDDLTIHGCVVRFQTPMLATAVETGAMLKQARDQIAGLQRAIEQV